MVKRFGVTRIVKRGREQIPLQPKPRNENAYKGCKVTMRKFFLNPSKKTYAAYDRALTALYAVNPTMALALRKMFNQQMFDRALKEENFK